MQNDQSKPAYVTIKPTVLYFGTPVALITTVDHLNKPNIGPVSSLWALGYNLMIGLGCDSKTYQNLLAGKSCVVNLPSPQQSQQVEQIAHLTGLYPVPLHKSARYSYAADKFAAGNFEAMPSQIVAPPAIAGCPIQLEGQLQNHYIIEYAADLTPLIACVQVKVVNVRVHEHLLIGDHHIDPSQWSPLIYNFRHYYALGKQMGKNFRADV